MTTPKRPTSGWVIAYSLLMLLVSLNTTVLGYAAPNLLFADAVGDYANAAPVLSFYATRNSAVTLLFAVALVTRARPLLFAAMLLRLVIDSVDLSFTLEYQILALSPFLAVPGWLLFFTVPQLASLWHLRDGASGQSFHFRFQEQVHIQAPGEKVWAKLSKHQSMPDWVLLGLKWVKLSSDGAAAPGDAGSLRTIRFVGWPPVTERLIEVQPPHRYSYGVIAGMPHLRDHLGQVCIDEQGDSVLLSWAITFDFEPLHPLSWMAPVFVAGFRVVVSRALLELKRQLEGENP